MMKNLGVTVESNPIENDALQIKSQKPSAWPKANLFILLLLMQNVHKKLKTLLSSILWNCVKSVLQPADPGPSFRDTRGRTEQNHSKEQGQKVLMKPMGENPDPSVKKLLHAGSQAFTSRDKGHLSHFFSISIEFSHLLLERKEISVTITLHKYSVW